MSADALPLPSHVSNRYLLRTQIRHEAQMKYVGSIAGIYWAIVNPLIQVGAYVFIATVIFDARIGATEGGRIDYAVFVLSGLAVWLAMQEGLMSAAGSLIRHGDIVRNVVFPLELLPIAAIAVSLLSLTIGLGTLVVLDVFSGHALGPSVVAFPVVLAVQLLLTFGLGFAFAVFTLFVRDLLFLLPVIFQMLTLLTPIAYSIEDMPDELQTVTRLNPLYHVIVSYRRIFFEGAWPSWPGLAYAAIVSALVLVGGVWVFRRLKGYAEALV
jgi:lipopolysaccharide transport system permease protein